MNEKLSNLLDEIEQIELGSSGIIANPFDHLQMSIAVFSCKALVHMAIEFSCLAEYVGALQENLQHIDDALQKAGKENM